MPAGAVYVGRGSKWGNPFKVGSEMCPTRKEAVLAYECLILSRFVHLSKPPVQGEAAIRAELHGKDLACWCPLDQPCHADVLIRIANPDFRPPADAADARTAHHRMPNNIINIS